MLWKLETLFHIIGEYLFLNAWVMVTFNVTSFKEMIFLITYIHSALNVDEDLTLLDTYTFNMIWWVHLPPDHLDPGKQDNPNSWPDIPITPVHHLHLNLWLYHLLFNTVNVSSINTQCITPISFPLGPRPYLYISSIWIYGRMQEGLEFTFWKWIRWLGIRLLTATARWCISCWQDEIHNCTVLCTLP